MSLDAWWTLLLVFARIAAFLSLLPVLSTNGVPKYVGIFLAVLLTVLVGPHVTVVAMPAGVEGILSIGSEVMLGLVVGTGVHAVFSSLTLASEVSSQQTGFAMMTLFDPVFKVSEGPLGILAAWLAGWVFLLSGLHLEFLLLVSESFQSVPPGTAAVSDTLAWSLPKVVGESIGLGVQLAGPVVVLVFLVNAFVGMLTRLAPRMNVFFSVGMSLTGTAGISLFALALPWMLATHEDAMRDVLGWAVHALGVR